jgi:signal transduction histidine kinase/CheY-like chemotaxis protein
VVDAPVARSYWVFGSMVVGSVLLGIVAAFFVSRAITTPMRALRAAAEAMGHGFAPTSPNTDLPEIRNVAAALIAAHNERESLLDAERRAKHLERDARVAAERANRLKDEFLAMLGHELRNPLAAISSASMVLELSKDKPSAEASVRSAIAIIRRQSQQLARLTDDLLDAGRVVLGRIKLDRRPLDLAGTVEGCVDTLRHSNGFAQHAVTVSLNPAWINGDATRISQVVTNLLTNAVRYTPAGGSIHVRVERVSGQAQLRVRDSGIGIEPDLLPRVFDLFVQGERTADRSEGGLGIGLTMVRQLVELHGGHVQVSSAGAGCGSEFTVSFPAIEDRATGDSDCSPRLAELPRSIAILEDNPDVQTALAEVLRLAGHRVTLASDGQSGIELVFKERPDIALVDIGLPIIDGYGVARALRASPDTQSVFLVAMTGYGSNENIAAGRAAGFDDYLVKPADEGRLGEVIRRAGRSDRSPTNPDNVVPFATHDVPRTSKGLGTGERHIGTAGDA